MFRNKFMPRRYAGPLAEINVVPYIDVMLVLLVVFMVTTPLLSQGIKVNLPQEQAQTINTPQEPLIVSLDREGRLYLNTAAHPERALDEAALKLELRQQLQTVQAKNKPLHQVFVKGDKDVNYGKIIHAMILLQQAGAANIGLITEPLQAATR